MEPELSAEYLRSVLSYDKRTGLFRWRVRKSDKIRAGDVAGCINGPGYRVIRIEDRLYLAHRLAVLYVTGAWPVRIVDHRNRIKSDNRWRNLREATYPQNGSNSNRKIGISGYRGVGLSRSGRRWHAHLRIDGRVTHLGYFASKEAAALAYNAAAIKHRGVFSQLNIVKGEGGV